MTTNTIPDIDFDDWTSEQEEAALKQLAQAAKCKYAIGDNHFYGKFPDGTIISMPLNLSLDDVNDITEGDVSSVDQFTRLIEKIAGKDDAKKFLHHEHRQAFTATFRERYNISANQIGTAIAYREAWDLTGQLLDDPGNPLCAELADWAYPARLIDLLQLAATIGDGKAAENIMPWTMQRHRNQIEAAKTTPDEINKALAELDEEIIIPTTIEDITE